MAVSVAGLQAHRCGRAGRGDRLSVVVGRHEHDLAVARVLHIPPPPKKNTKKNRTANRLCHRIASSNHLHNVDRQGVPSTVHGYCVEYITSRVRVGRVHENPRTMSKCRYFIYLFTHDSPIGIARSVSSGCCHGHACRPDLNNNNNAGKYAERNELPISVMQHTDTAQTQHSQSHP